MKDCPYNHRLVDTKSILPAVQKVVAGSSQMQDIIKVSKFFEDSWDESLEDDISIAQNFLAQVGASPVSALTAFAGAPLLERR
ncbi:hypothetical protein GX48_05645 [Paracoccidioides brasiliensis]|nr:hypothetical protein GX48_05645 [Paracoccidioides brasiliensis]